MIKSLDDIENAKDSKNLDVRTWGIDWREVETHIDLMKDVNEIKREMPNG